MPLAQPNKTFEAALSEGIWQVGIDVTFASGKKANNKIDWEQVFVYQEATADPQHPRNFQLTSAGKLVVGQMAEMIDRFKPDLLAGVPTGGQRFAMAIGRELDVEVARLKKVKNEPGLKTYDYETPDEREKVEQSSRLTLVEDATSEFTSLRGAIQLVDATEGERVLEVTAIHRRDDGSNELPIDVPIDWLIADAPIPNLLTPDHPTFQRFGHLAVGQLS